MLPALRFDHVTKTFIHHTGPMLLRDRVIEMFKPSTRPRFAALKDVSFELAPGESRSYRISYSVKYPKDKVLNIN